MTLIAQLFQPRTIVFVVINSVIAYILLGKYYAGSGRPKEWSPGNGKSSHKVVKPSQGSALPPLEYRDYILSDLRKFDGIQDPRILIALDMRVFDVTSAKHLYGPGGSYACFAGRDASRAMAKGELMSLSQDELQEYDYLLDLPPKERDTLNEWVDFFGRKYETVGTLLAYYLTGYFSDGEPFTGGFIP